MLALYALATCLVSDDVFVSGVLDPSQPFSTYRIPAITKTKRNTLLAFAEGRRSVNDQASNVIVLRRKAVRSNQWQPLQIVVRDEPASLNNPCILATRSGRVWLMYQRYPASVHEYSAPLGYDENSTCQSYVVHSDDDGQTWSAPVNLTTIVRRPTIKTVASGPGVGIELSEGEHKGRLVFPFNEGADRRWTVFSVYSDDQGKTWQRGEPAASESGTNPNEVQFAEVGPGLILANARNQASERFRLLGTSRDGGHSWDTFTLNKALPDPICMGSMVRMPSNKHVLINSNPTDQRERKHGVLKLSYDDGRSWIDGPIVEEGSFAYSCLVPISASRVGVLYETVETKPGVNEGYRIRYREFSINR